MGAMPTGGMIAVSSLGEDFGTAHSPLFCMGRNYCAEQSYFATYENYSIEPFPVFSVTADIDS
jgi:hypothetical protein